MLLLVLPRRECLKIRVMMDNNDDGYMYISHVQNTNMPHETSIFNCLCGKEEKGRRCCSIK